MFPHWPKRDPALLYQSVSAAGKRIWITRAMFLLVSYIFQYALRRLLSRIMQQWHTQTSWKSFSLLPPNLWEQYQSRICMQIVVKSLRKTTNWPQYGLDKTRLQTAAWPRKFIANFFVCTEHFLDGKPTRANPYHTSSLSDSTYTALLVEPARGLHHHGWANAQPHMAA